MGNELHCCERRYTTTPAGHIRVHHDRSCPLWPGQVIGTERSPRSRRERIPALQPQQQRMPHDWRSCELPTCVLCEEFEAHMDDDDDTRSATR